MQTVKERLIAFLKHEKISQKKFAESIGVSTGFVNAIRVSISPVTLSKIQSAYPILNIEWLITGEGEMLRDSNAKEVGGVYTAISGDDDVVMVDYVPVSACAPFLESLSGSSYWEEKFPIVPMGNERNDIEKLKIFEVEGDSMYPTLVSGALILAKEIPECSWHYAEGVVVAVYGEFVVVKRVYANRLLTDNFIVLASDNEKYGTMTVPLSDLRGLYKAKRILNSPIL